MAAVGVEALLYESLVQDLSALLGDAGSQDVHLLVGAQAERVGAHKLLLLSRSVARLFHTSAAPRRLLCHSYLVHVHVGSLQLRAHSSVRACVRVCVLVQVRAAEGTARAVAGGRRRGDAALGGVRSEDGAQRPQVCLHGKGERRQRRARVDCVYTQLAVITNCVVNAGSRYHNCVSKCRVHPLQLS